MRSARHALCLCALLGCDAAPRARTTPDSHPPPTAAGSDTPAGVAMRGLHISAFSRTTGYRHEAIEPARAALAELAHHNAATFAATEDPVELTTMLARTDVVVFLMTTGDVLDDAQQGAFEAFVRAGGGFVGVHSAADTEYDWPFYATLNGALFDSHPAIQTATLRVEPSEHRAVRGLPRSWSRSDEWYNFRENPRGRVQVLATIDESSYEGGTMGADHPMIWCHSGAALGRGRALYSALGHTRESWQDATFLAHIEGALLWAAGRE